MAPRIILDFPRSDGRPARRLFYAPQCIISARTHADVLPALEEVGALTDMGATAVGFISYEAAPAFDAAMQTHPPGTVPLLWFAIFEQEKPAMEPAGDYSERPSWRPDTAPDQHARAVARIHEEIAAGTTYQVNYTVRMHASFNADVLAAYESLRRAQGAGYHALIETDEWCVISLSPELFFETDGRTLRTRPMKGTRPRGRFLEEDERLADELRSSDKERAENLMIIDLMRNDTGRIALPGSVVVTRLYDVERYPTVWQMTSTVEATLRDDVALPDIMRALFPPGSVTGAPKISTMRLIAELEQSPRGIYCGALGIVERHGMTFNVPIRTMWIDRRTGIAEYGTGSGITTDARAADEYSELLAKAVVVTESWPQFQLLETMRAERGEIVRLDLHLARMRDSADYFGFEFGESAVRELLQRHCTSLSAPARVRLRLSENGEARVDVSPLDDLPPRRAVTLATESVSSRNRMLYHKTTARTLYEQHAQRAPDCFDVLLFNERGELTEFTRANLVLELDGRRLTPARTCGLLAGVFREELLVRQEIEEAVLTKADLARATRVWWINSVREWVEVEQAWQPPAEAAKSLSSLIYGR